MFFPQSLGVDFADHIILCERYIIEDIRGEYALRDLKGK
jgi:hypothetical protein